MNQQCKVCGEPAAGFHFGAFTCEGCKSFFGRTYNNLGSISECKNGGVCVINKKNRTACKACRLRKCLMVGMSKSGSRYGRRSNWFKIHCLLQEQSNNNHQSAAGLAASHFGPSFLPGFLPGLQSPSQQGLVFGAKDGRDQTSPSQEDLALQSHLLHVAMMKQKGRDRGDKSPRPDDLALQNQLKLLAWQKEEERALQQQQQQQQQRSATTTPPGNGTPPSVFPYKDLVSSSSMFAAVNFGQKEAPGGLPSSSLEVFRPFLPIYKRTTDTPSDSGASSVETDEHDESRSNSAFGYFKREAGSPPLGLPPTTTAATTTTPPTTRTTPLLAGAERDYPPRRKINATVTLTTDFLGPHHGHHGHLVYPPAELVTPATSHHSLRGGDLLLASPSPGGLAVEQMEPIDLSVRSTKSYHHGSSQTPERKSHLHHHQQQLQQLQQQLSDREGSSSPDGKMLAPESAAKGNPLDLSIDVKRPAEISL